jgi:hypothetical protein
MRELLLLAAGTVISGVMRAAFCKMARSAMNAGAAAALAWTLKERGGGPCMHETPPARFVPRAPLDDGQGGAGQGRAGSLDHE